MSWWRFEPEPCCYTRVSPGSACLSPPDITPDMQLFPLELYLFSQLYYMQHVCYMLIILVIIDIIYEAGGGCAGECAVCLKKDAMSAHKRNEITLRPGNI